MGNIVDEFNTAPTTVGTAIVAYSLSVAGFVMLGAGFRQCGCPDCAPGPFPRTIMESQLHRGALLPQVGFGLSGRTWDSHPGESDSPKPSTPTAKPVGWHTLRFCSHPEQIPCRVALLHLFLG